MQKKLIFIIGMPRSGSTLLQRMLGSHQQIATHPEPHILTPLAHLGFYQNVQKAPYDHINAAEAIRQFVEELPGQEADYLDACRAYTDILYGRMLQKLGKERFLDKTPGYALVLPFLSKLYPEASYIVLTRHPLAILSSYANSFFEGDLSQAIEFNNILGRYLPAMAAFMEKPEPSKLVVCYETLVSQPEAQLERIFDFLNLPHQASAVCYGKHKHIEKSYGDPKVKHQTRPTTASVSQWACEFSSQPEKLKLAQAVVAPIDPRDFEAYGYPKADLFQPLEEACPKKILKDWRWMTDSYRFQRRVFLTLRKAGQKPGFQRMVKRVRYYCDVLLRE